MPRRNRKLHFFNRTVAQNATSAWTWCLKKPILFSFFLLFFAYFWFCPSCNFLLSQTHTHTLSGYFPPLGKDRTARCKKCIPLRNKDFVYGIIIRKTTVKSSMAASLAARQLWQKSTKWVCYSYLNSGWISELSNRSTPTKPGLSIFIHNQ